MIYLKHMRFLSRYAGYFAWVIALLSMAISLYFSDVRGFVPCNLCWYARILMYPLVTIIGIGIIRRDRNWVVYAAPLVALGWVLELYHSLLQWGVIPEVVTKCLINVPCTTKNIDYFGFVTIPFLALLAFSGLAACLLVYWFGSLPNENQ